MRILILIRQHLYIETTFWSFQTNDYIKFWDHCICKSMPVIINRHHTISINDLGEEWFRQHKIIWFNFREVTHIPQILHIVCQRCDDRAHWWCLTPKEIFVFFLLCDGPMEKMVAVLPSMERSFKNYWTSCIEAYYFGIIFIFCSFHKSTYECLSSNHWGWWVGAFARCQVVFTCYWNI